MFATFISPCRYVTNISLQWLHNDRGVASSYRRLDCLSRHRSKKISKFRVTGLCAGNSQVTSNASMWCRHHALVVWLVSRRQDGYVLYPMLMDASRRGAHNAGSGVNYDALLEYLQHSYCLTVISPAGNIVVYTIADLVLFYTARPVGIPRSFPQYS